MESTFFVCLILIGFLNLTMSEECTTPTQVAGTCVDIKDCQPLLALLQREGVNAADFARRFLCNFEGQTPMVCCPGNPGGTMEQNLYGPLLPPQCGFTNVSHTRVVDGVPAKLNAWPWIVALGFRETPTSNMTFECGGSLISARHVLTAAHCADRDDLVIVRLGDLDLTSDNDGARPIELGFEKKIIHPEYNRNRRTNDVAILRLERDVQFTYNIHPICLPVGQIAKQNFSNTNPFYAGWGALSFRGEPSNILREVQLPVVTNEFCANKYSGVRRAPTIDNRLICAGGNGKDTCTGDSGGPAMLPINGSFYVIGVVSGGYKCAEPGFPGISSRVTSFLQFIISNLQ